MKSRRLIIILLIIAIIVCFWFWRRYQMQKSQQAKIQTSAVVKKNLPETVSSSGKALAKEQVNLHFQTLGRLAWVGVKEGDSVQAYQAIASLDVKELEKNLIKTLRDYSKERDDFEEDRLVTYKDKPITDTIKRVLEKTNGIWIKQYWMWKLKILLYN